MIREIQTCTEIEARTILQDNSWSLSEEEIYHLLAIIIMLQRGVLVKGQPLSSLCVQ